VLLPFILKICTWDIKNVRERKEGRNPDSKNIIPAITQFKNQHCAS